MKEINESMAVERLVHRFEKYNTQVLKEMGKTIGMFKELTPSQAHKLAMQLKYGGNIEEIIKQLVKYSGLSIQDIETMLNKACEYEISLSKPFYKEKGINIPTIENEPFKAIIRDTAKITNGLFSNLANTTAIRLIDKDGVPKLYNIRQAYYEVIDRSVLAVETGQESFDSAMAKTIKQLSDSGVRQVYYDNVGKTRTYIKNGIEYTEEVKRTYTKRLDSAIRESVYGALADISNRANEQIADEIDADGWEITHEENPAPDHIVIDGKQFSFKEWEELNDSLERKQGQWNCRHRKRAILLDINEPIYSQKQLQVDYDKNNKGFEYEGQHYTLYEGTQLQRQIETKLRTLQDRENIAKASGNQELLDETNIKIDMLLDKYSELSRISGLPTKLNRIRNYYK